MLVRLETLISKRTSSLEMVQRKAVLFCNNSYHPTTSITKMLQELGWTTLDLRRTMSLLIFPCKMSQGKIDIDTTVYLHLTLNSEHVQATILDTFKRKSLGTFISILFFPELEVGTAYLRTLSTPTPLNIINLSF